MVKKLRIWVVVADSARAQLFIPDEKHTGLIAIELPGVPPETAHPLEGAVKSDRPGRGFSSAGGGIRHAIESRHDYRKLAKHEFAAGVAHALNRACLADQFDRLVLIVPSRTLGELRNLLDGRVQERMHAIGKDLTKTALPELWLEVQDLVRKPSLIAPPAGTGS